MSPGEHQRTAKQSSIRTHIPWLRTPTSSVCLCARPGSRCPIYVNGCSCLTKNHQEMDLKVNSAWKLGEVRQRVYPNKGGSPPPSMLFCCLSPISNKVEQVTGPTDIEGFRARGEMWNSEAHPLKVQLPACSITDEWRHSQKRGS